MTMQTHMLKHEKEMLQEEEKAAREAAGTYLHYYKPMY
jgi:hypothetical protein